MRDVSNGAIPKSSPASRGARIHRRMHLLRRTAVVASVLGFAGVWNLVAHHSVGITARAGPAPSVQSNNNLPGASSSDSGGFFDNGGGDGNSNGSGVGGGSGSSPVVGTGGS